MKKINIKNLTIKELVLAIVMVCICFMNVINSASASTIGEDLEQYITQTRRSIKNNWYPPASSYQNSATMVLTLDRDGQLLDCRLSEPSPSEEFNNSLINAAKKTVYAPFPKRFLDKSTELEFTFGMQRRNVTNNTTIQEVR